MLEPIPDGIPDYARAPVPESEVRSIMRGWGLSSAQQQKIRQMSWIADGVARYEVEAVIAIAAALRSDFPTAIDLPWVQDGLDSDETKALGSLAWLDANNLDAVVSTILAKPWTRDDLNFHEANAVNALANIAQEQSDSIAISFLDMPFLETLEPVDALALTGLADWAWDFPEHFQKILDHPFVADGITDEESRSITQLLGTLQGETQTLLAKTELPKPETVGVEERVVQLPLTEENTIRIVRPLPGSPCTMNTFESILPNLVEFMSLPLPVHDVNFVFTPTPDYRVPHYNATSYIYAREEFETSESCIEDKEYVPLDSIYAHEAAHYYWSRGETWIVEGAAELFEDVWLNPAVGLPIAPTTINDCREFANISELEQHDGELEGDRLWCAYTLGSLLFHDLYRNMDESTFRQSFRHLYLLSRFDDPGDACDSPDTGICHLRAAFTKFVPVSEKATINQVIDKWYLGDHPRYWTGEIPWVNGVLIGSDGEPLEGIDLSINKGDIAWPSTTNTRGEFVILSEPGVFKLFIVPPDACELNRWYDASDLAISEEAATVLEVDGRTPFEPIRITLPVTNDDIQTGCGARAIRGVLVSPEGDIWATSGADGELTGFAQVNIYASHEGIHGDISSATMVPGFDSFELRVKDGSAIQIRVQGITVSGEWHELGWLGENGLVPDSGDAKTFVVDGADIEGIEITLAEPSLADTPTPVPLYDAETETCALTPLTPAPMLGPSKSLRELVPDLYSEPLQWPALTEMLAAVPWIRDGIDRSEEDAALDLAWGLNAIAEQRGEKEALRVTQMPFFESLSLGEATTVRALGWLVYDDPVSYAQLMNYPALERGITDHLAMIIPMLNYVDSGMWDRVLDDNFATIEVRTIELPLAGSVEVSVVHVHDGPQLMDSVEYALRLNECLAGVPFPVRHVTVQMIPDLRVGGFLGGTTVGLRAGLADFEYESLLVHEIAHAYYHDGPGWITEGAAVFVQLLDRNLRFGASLSRHGGSCPHVDSVSAYDRALRHEIWMRNCMYPLGEAILVDLYRFLSSEAFFLGFRKLHIALEQSDDLDQPVGFDEFREIFGGSEAANLVLDLWYEGADAFAKTLGDEAPPNPSALPGNLRPFKFITSIPPCRAPDCWDYSASFVEQDELGLGMNFCFMPLTASRDYVESRVDALKLLEMELIVFFEDGTEIHRVVPEPTRDPDSGWFYRFPGPPSKLDEWQFGTYYLFLYHNGTKIGQSWFHILP